MSVGTIWRTPRHHHGTVFTTKEHKEHKERTQSASDLWATSAKRRATGQVGQSTNKFADYSICLQRSSPMSRGPSFRGWCPGHGIDRHGQARSANLSLRLCSDGRGEPFRVQDDGGRKRRSPNSNFCSAPVYSKESTRGAAPIPPSALHLLALRRFAKQSHSRSPYKAQRSG